MPEPERPPDNPPDEPIVSSGATPAAGSAAAALAKTDAAPSFTAEQVGNILEQGIEKAFARVIKPQAPAVSTMADAPTGPDPSELNRQIASLNSEIDSAVANGGNISALMSRRDTLRDQIFEHERVAPLRAQGGQSINEVVLDRMNDDPYFKRYKDEVMALLSPAIKQGTVLRLEMVREATNLVKGRHTDEILATDREQTIRKSKTESLADLPGAANGRTLSAAGRGASGETVLDVFGERADAAFQYKRDKGMDEEAFAQKIGYKGGKAEWYRKTRELDAGDHTFGLDKNFDKATGKWIDPTEPT